MELKYCKFCKEEHEVPGEHWSQSGKYFRCKKQQVRYAMAYAKAHPEETKRNAKKFRDGHKKALADQKKEIYNRKKEQYLERGKQYRERIKGTEKELRRKQARREWQDRTREQRKEYNRVRARERRRSNPAARLKDALYHRLWMGLKHNKKSTRLVELLGCSWVELRTYLEQQFTAGMSWENYGKTGWEVDHITPLCAFDLSDPEQLKRAWHYTNLRPLRVEDNNLKSQEDKKKSIRAAKVSRQTADKQV